MTKKYAIGIDIGGTKISLAAGDLEGRIVSHHLMPTVTGSETAAGIRRMIDILKNMTSVPQLKNKIAGIGIGIPGPVDTKSGIVPFSPNLKGWKGMKLPKMIRDTVRLPVVMGNDANAAALGEKHFGQGKGVSDFIYMTVSTGVGSGIVINGKLLEGKSFVAGEIGHMTVVPRGALCKCGKRGCLEAYASGTGMTRMAKETLSRKAIGEIAKLNAGDKELSAKTIGLAARKGHKESIAIYQKGGYFLGLGISNLLNTLNPEKIILGGGVFKSAPKHFEASMMASCLENAWPEALKAVKIVYSRLQGRVGDLGAIALAFEHFKK